MENKYYTPTIEEFHVGFEYEYKYSDKGWTFKVYEPHFTINNVEVEEYCRVKHLDKEDIESLGFEQIEYDTYKKENIYIELNMEYKTFISAIKQGESSILFQGTIKNKSELKKLLKQLGINGNN